MTAITNQLSWNLTDHAYCIVVCLLKWVPVITFSDLLISFETLAHLNSNVDFKFRFSRIFCWNLNSNIFWGKVSLSKIQIHIHNIIDHSFDSKKGLQSFFFLFSSVFFENSYFRFETVLKIEIYNHASISKNNMPEGVD